MEGMPSRSQRATWSRHATRSAYVVGGPALPEGEPIGARSVQFPAWVSLVRWELAQEARVASAAEVLSHAAWAGPALVRGFC